MLRKSLTLLLLLYLLSSPVMARYTEKHYVDKWCVGEKEVTLSDKTRCDCVTKEHAIEFDFAPKWAEAIGQSLHYAAQTKKLPGIVLICRKKTDRKHLNKIRNISKLYRLPITVWGLNCGL